MGSLLSPIGLGVGAELSVIVTVRIEIMTPLFPPALPPAFFLQDTPFCSIPQVSSRLHGRVSHCPRLDNNWMLSPLHFASVYRSEKFCMVSAATSVPNGTMLHTSQGTLIL